MDQKKSQRRNFIKKSLSTAGLGLIGLPAIQESWMESSKKENRPFPQVSILKNQLPEIRFSVIGLNHGHIYSQVEAMLRNGGVLYSVFAKEADLLQAFIKRYPTVKTAKSETEILDDKSIVLVLSASIPVDRAPLGIRVMQAGKDFMVDKPGITSLDQLAKVRKVQKETKRIYSIMYSERFENRATVKAGHLVKSGAIGQVIQTIGLGPHRMNIKSRPSWFFDKKYFGGILCDIGSHQCDQFLFFTGSTKAEVSHAQVGNIHYPQYPSFEDFGEMNMVGDKGTGYIRVDWFTPDGLASWGDGRLTILGTDGFIELRKNVDIAGHSGGNHLFLVDNKETKYIDCSQEPLLYGKELIADIRNRTETAMSQDHCFLATELSLKAAAKAKKLMINKNY